MKEDFLYLKSYPEFPINISLAGISYCDGSYHITRKCSSVTVIEYVLEGEGTINYKGKSHTVTADNIYILQKGEAQDYYSSAEKPLKKIFINLSGDFALELLKRYRLENGIIFEGKALKYLFERIQKAVNIGDDSASSYARLCATYFEIIENLAILKNHPNETSVSYRLKKYLDDNTHRIVKNSELATQIYRSQDYIVKLFSASYGITPYEYQLKEKMHIAKRLLKNTAMPISEIALSIGYNDPHYFSGLFKKRIGLSPREYRKN